ncbi:hypothetical protein [Thermococcus sp. JCM 11816]|uniref:hypothetical protein n=1 Tax=Thermococcus sp. (strain JCM 11816 / KS-1) TaxID=1295125 RepID=UPI003465E3BA
MVTSYSHRQAGTRGPTATFGFIATGSEPVEAMYLYVNDQLWDVWPETASAPPGNESTPSDNQTNPNPSPGNETNPNPSPGNETGPYVPAGPGLPEHFFAPIHRHEPRHTQAAR